MSGGSGLGIPFLLHTISIILTLGLSVVGIYLLFLCIRLAHKGIQALDIYIRKNS